MNNPIKHINEQLPYDSTVIFEAFPSGVIVCDNKGIIQHCNSELTKLFGYSREELLEQPIEILLPESLRHSHGNLFRHYISNPEKRSMGTGRELFACRKDNTTFPVEIGLNPLSTATGTQIVATVIDISERQKLDANFRNIVEAAPVGMLIVDTHAEIKVVNRHLLHLFGYEEDELVGKKIEVLIPDRHRTHHIDYRKNYLTAPTRRAMGDEQDLTGLHKDGTEILVEVGLNPIETNNGTNVIAAISDVTERKRSELKLQQVNADLDEFTYVASHDLRSPLRGISSLIDWIGEDLEEALNDNIPKDVTNNLNRAQLRISRMEKLIDDLLSYARAGRSNSSIDKINITKVIEDAIELAALPDSAKVTINCNLETISASKIPLETVLRNIISNAVKHNDKDILEINIEVTKDGSFCIFKISDNGPGIPTNAHERVFKLFQSLSKDNEQRSGVGLAVCKRLVEAHDGEISLETDTNNKGACFTFSWPRFPRRDLNE